MRKNKLLLHRMTVRNLTAPALALVIGGIKPALPAGPQSIRIGGRIEPC
jgi:hypothetical protein